MESSPGGNGEKHPFMLRTRRKGTGDTFNGQKLVVSTHHEKHSFVNWLQLERLPIIGEMRFSHLAVTAADLGCAVEQVERPPLTAQSGNFFDR